MQTSQSKSADVLCQPSMVGRHFQDTQILQGCELYWSQFRSGWTGVLSVDSRPPALPPPPTAVLHVTHCLAPWSLCAVKCNPSPLEKQNKSPIISSHVHCQVLQYICIIPSLPLFPARVGLSWDTCLRNKSRGCTHTQNFSYPDIYWCNV